MNLLATIGGLLAVFAMLATAIRAASLPEGVRVTAWIHCVVVRGSHDPRRHSLGGQQCAGCGLSGADMTALGFEDGGYVRSPRRVYDRGRKQSTVTSEWSEGKRGW